MTSVLEASGVYVGYNDVPVVQDLSLSVAAGEIVAILGANGAGKTTAMLALAGELRPSRGVVRLHGHAADGPLWVRAKKGLAFISEERSVFMGLSTRENLRLGRGELSRALELFPELEPLLERRAGLLSGGEQQILTLARALAAHPSVLLIDELSLGLAPMVVDRLFAALREAAKNGVAVCMVEQHVSAALELADWAYVLDRGRVVLEGSARDLAGRLDELQEFYLSSSAVGSSSRSPHHSEVR